MQIRVDYDGLNNDVEPHEGWGEKKFLPRRPVIELPISNTEIEVGQPFAVSGKDGLKDVDIRLFHFESPSWVQRGPSFRAGSGGRWSTTTTLPPGVTTFAVDAFVNGEDSGLSNNVGIKPIVLPPTIEQPLLGVVIEDMRPLISGRGRDDSIVQVWQTNPYRIPVSYTHLTLPTKA